MTMQIGFAAVTVGVGADMAPAAAGGDVPATGFADVLGAALAAEAEAEEAAVPEVVGAVPAGAGVAGPLRMLAGPGAAWRALALMAQPPGSIAGSDGPDVQLVDADLAILADDATDMMAGAVGAVGAGFAVPVVVPVIAAPTPPTPCGTEAGPPRGEPVAGLRGPGRGFDPVPTGADAAAPVGVAAAPPTRAATADQGLGVVPVAANTEAVTALPLRGGDAAAAQPERGQPLADGPGVAAAPVAPGPSAVAGAAAEVATDAYRGLNGGGGNVPGRKLPGDRSHDGKAADPLLQQAVAELVPQQTVAGPPAGAAAGVPFAPSTAIAADAGGDQAAGALVRSGDAVGAVLVTSERLGDVRIGLEGGPQDLRISLVAGAGSAGVLAADAQRLAAELAANGLRMQSLDVSGGGDGRGSGGGSDGRAASGNSGDGRWPRSSATDVASVFAGDAPVGARDRRSLQSDRYA